jgi:hypothetical protein
LTQPFIDATHHVSYVLKADLDIHLLRYGQRVLNLDTEVSDRTFQLGMPE